MSKFAKLFERDGEQVIAIATQTDDGKPCLHFLTDIGGAMAEPKLIFKDGDWDKRDKALETTDEAEAFAMRDHLIAKYGDKL